MVVILAREVTAVESEIDSNLCLGRLSVAVCEFANKMVRITSFAKSFGNVRRNAPRRAANLIG